MRIEASVFDCHHRLRDERRHFMQTYCLPAGCSAICNQRAININNTKIGRTVRNSPICGGWHFSSKVNKHSREGDASPQTQDQSPIKSPAYEREKTSTSWRSAAV